MKKPFRLTLLMIVFIACTHASGDKTIQKDDSLQYYPPTPPSLSKEEFRHYYRQLNSFFDSTLLRSGFNGGIIVAKNGQILYEKYVGFADLRIKDSMTDHTPLHIASTSKTFMSIAILRLVQENKLSLADTINKFFPNLPYQGITVQMLLNHRSGLPNYLYFVSNSEWNKAREKQPGKYYITNEEMLNVLCTEKPNRSFAPDTRFSYSNTNFVLLAMILEQVTGRSYPEYMKQKFFDPLQMNNTYVFTMKDSLTATPSFKYSGNYWDYDMMDATYGDKNIYSTPRDLLKWDQALYTNQILRQSLLDSAFAPYSNERPSIHNYGLGWRLQMLPNGKKVIYHFGKWHGNNAAFARLTDEKATIIILGNRYTRSVYNAAHKCYDLFGPYFQNGEDDEETDTLNTKSVSKRSHTKSGKAG